MCQLHVAQLCCTVPLQAVANTGGGGREPSRLRCAALPGGQLPVSVHLGRPQRQPQLFSSLSKPPCARPRSPASRHGHPAARAEGRPAQGLPGREGRLWCVLALQGLGSAKQRPGCTAARRHGVRASCRSPAAPTCRRSPTHCRRGWWRGAPRGRRRGGCAAAAAAALVPASPGLLQAPTPGCSEPHLCCCLLPCRGPHPGHQHGSAAHQRGLCLRIGRSRPRWALVLLPPAAAPPPAVGTHCRRPRPAAAAPSLHSPLHQCPRIASLPFAQAAPRTWEW